MTILRWLALIAVLCASGFLGYSAVRHGLAEHWAASSNPDLWLRAANLEPGNADNWYRLGRYRQLDFANGDLSQAISDYRRATEIEPINASYWLDLAAAYETAGDEESAEHAYRTAQDDYPISGEVAWRYGNFLLRQNRIDEAFRQIQHAVAVDPDLASLAVSRCWLSTPDADRILQSALPDTPDAYWGALQFFTDKKDPAAALAAWKRLAAFGTKFPLYQASPLMDLLIQTGNAEGAHTVWLQALAAAGITATPSPDGSLIWDGGFEGDLLNAGFGWRYEPIPGAELSWDEQTVHSGRRSLQVTFDGTDNVNFQQVSQFVVVEPGTKYRFSAYIRAQDLSTDRGIHFEIRDASNPNAPDLVTPDVMGTQPWKLDDLEFSTGPQTRLLRVVLRREASSLLGKVRGTAWVDDVALVQDSSAGQP